MISTSRHVIVITDDGQQYESGLATPEQIAASDAAPHGIIRVDQNGDVIDPREMGQPWLTNTTTVWVTEPS